MRSLLLFLLGYVAPLASTAALPASVEDTTTSGANKTAGSIDSPAAPALPVSAFPKFDTLTLDEALSDPSLLDPNPDTPGESSNTTSGANRLVQAASQCDSPAKRIEWNSYSDSDRAAFLDALACLVEKPSAGSQYAPSKSRYEDIVWTHQVMTDKVHGDGVFLLWHRWFVKVVEGIMRDECGFESPMPWWDETHDAGHFAESSIFTDDYFGSLPPAGADDGGCIMDGKFANLTCNVGPGTDNTVHCLSRGVDETQTAENNAAYVSHCARNGKFGTFSKCVEQGPHAWGHNGIGMVMSDLYCSVSDPVFWLHHGMVDHEFASWQEAGGSDSNERKTTVSRVCADKDHPCDELTVDWVLEMKGLGEDVTVADVLDTRGSLCYEYDYY